VVGGPTKPLVVIGGACTGTETIGKLRGEIVPPRRCRLNRKTPLHRAHAPDKAPLFGTSARAGGCCLIALSRTRAASGPCLGVDLAVYGAISAGIEGIIGVAPGD
jgi:hypothetical protein